MRFGIVWETMAWIKIKTEDEELGASTNEKRNSLESKGVDEVKDDELGASTDEKQNSFESKGMYKSEKVKNTVEK